MGFVAQTARPVLVTVHDSNAIWIKVGEAVDGQLGPGRLNEVKEPPGHKVGESFALVFFLW